MRKFISTILLLGIAGISFAQKVDLDKSYFDINYQKLPNEPVFLEERTYKVSCKTGGGINSNAKDIEGKSSFMVGKKLKKILLFLLK